MSSLVLYGASYSVYIRIVRTAAMVDYFTQTDIGMDMLNNYPKLLDWWVSIQREPWFLETLYPAEKQSLAP